MRTTSSIVAVALGVAVLFAGLATNAAIEVSVQRAVTRMVGQADLRVASFGEAGLSAETVAAIASTPGVDVAVPTLEQRTYLQASGFDGTLPPPVTVVGIDPSTDGAVHDLDLRAGATLVDTTEPSALITERLAEQDGLGLGSRVTMQAGGDPQTFRVIGIIGGEGPVNGANGRTVMVPLGQAETVFGRSVIDRVDIVVAEGVDPRTVEAALEDRLVSQPYVLSSPQDLAADLRASTTDFSLMTGLIAMVALCAGAFLIFNTLSMTVSDRIREVGLLRAAGATRRQVMIFILTQASVIAVAGSLLGLLLGIALAAAMVVGVGTVGAVTIDRSGLPLDAAAVAVLVGIAVTLAASLEPAHRASRIQPVDALRPQRGATSWQRARLRWLAVVFVAIGLASIVIVPRDAGGDMIGRAVAIYAVLLIATLCIPLILPIVARVAGAPFGLVVRVEERLARSAIGRDPSRTALTLGSLTVGLAMIVALGGVGEHARATAASWIDGVIPGDLVLTSIRPVAFDEGVDDALLTAVPGIERLSPIATFDVAVDGARTDAAAVVGADLAADGRLTFIAGDRTAALTALDGVGTTIIPAGMAERLSLSVGDAFTVPTTDGSELSLRVTGIIERSIPGDAGESLLVGWSDATGRLGVAGADVFAIRFAPDAPASARAGLHAEAESLALQVVPLGEIEGAISVALERIFGLFDALAIVAVIIAALGIVNTLTINVIERVRELGILRAAGMSRRQVWRSVVVEAGILGLAGAVLGIGLGLVIGAMLVVATGDTVGLGTGMPWSVIVLALVIGVAVAMLAAAYPARIASRLPIVRAVQYE
jgi:putative ABC transport system permease protein